MQLLVWLAYTAGLVAVVQGKAKGDRNVRRIEPTRAITAGADDRLCDRYLAA